MPVSTVTSAKPDDQQLVAQGLDGIVGGFARYQNRPRSDLRDRGYRHLGLRARIDHQIVVAPAQRING